MGRDHHVVAVALGPDGDSDRLLADREVQRQAAQRPGDELVEVLLDAADQQHLPVEVDRRERLARHRWVLASASHVASVMPSRPAWRNLYFSTFWLGVLGKASKNST